MEVLKHHNNGDRFKVQVSSRKFQNLDKIPTIVYFVLIASLDCMDSHVYSREISKRDSKYISSLTHFGVGGGVAKTVEVAGSVAVEVVAVAAAADSM